MNMNRILPLSLLTALVACGADRSMTEDTNTPKSSSAAAGLLLAADPGDAITVLAAKAKGAADDIVVVQGRVHDITKGFGILKLMDTALHYCGEVHEDACKTPWDYCCDSVDAHREHSLLVEFRGADGMPIETDALPNTRLLDLLKIRGKLIENEHKSLVLVADGIWQAERPKLPDGLDWPQ